jgi:hypothetical protein
MTKYTKAMTQDTAVDNKMKYLSKDHNFILIANNKKKSLSFTTSKTMAEQSSNPPTR